LDRFARRGGGPRRAGALDRRSFVRGLAVDDPEVVALFVGQEPRPVVFKLRLDVLFEDLFGFKKMAVASMIMIAAFFLVL
jgi:hypothetical protein